MSSASLQLPLPRSRQRTAAAAAAGTVVLHVLEKLWAVSRVLLFSCRSPKHVFSLARVSRAFAECMIEYQHAKNIFDRVFDARNRWQSEADVQQVWLQAAEILRDCNVQHCNAALVSEMTAALRAENLRGLAEYDAAVSSPRERDDKQHPEFNTPGSCVPHPACARHRFTQQVGSCALVFRNLRRNIAWFGSGQPHVGRRVCNDEASLSSAQPAARRTKGRAVKQNAAAAAAATAAASSAAPPVSPVISDSAHYAPEMNFSMSRGSAGFMSVFWYAGQPRVDVDLDLSFLPPTLNNCDSDQLVFTLYWHGTTFERPVPDFIAQVASACPRMRSFGICCPGMRVRLSSLRQLPRWATRVALQCQLYTDAGVVLDFSDLPAGMSSLDIGGSQLEAEISGVAPAALLWLFANDTKLKFLEQQRPTLTIF
jgi:hypothetical protein